MSKNLDDSFNEFAIEKPFGTYNGFELNSKLTNRIHYIFTKNLDVYKYKHIYKKLPNGLWPSDHLPIFVSINEWLGFIQWRFSKIDLQLQDQIIYILNNLILI